MLKYYLYKLAQFIVNRLNLKSAYGFAMFVADLHYIFAFRDRKAVRDNLSVILKIDPHDKKLRQKTREVFRNFGKYLTDFFRMARYLDDTYIEQKVRIHNLGTLQAALNQSRGVILITAHIGNWELGTAALAKVLDIPVKAVAQPHKERVVNNLFNKQRETHNMQIIPSHNALRPCMETLKNKGIIGIVADRDVTGTGLRMDFLGKKTMIPKGPALLSLKTRCPMVPCFMIPKEDHSFDLIIEDAVCPDDLTRDADSDEDMMTLTKKLVHVIEKKIFQHPAQWLVFRRFWV